MSAMPSSDDVAVWLRLQIAAGRIPGDADSSHVHILARKLGVSVATISAAYEQLCSASAGCRARQAALVRHSGFSTVARLVDQIVELDGTDSEAVSNR